MKQQSVKGRSLGTSKLSNARLSKSGFTLGRKGIGKSGLVKILLKDFCRIDIGNCKIVFKIDGFYQKIILNICMNDI